MYGDEELVKGAPGIGLVAGGRGLSLRRGWGCTAEEWVRGTR